MAFQNATNTGRVQRIVEYLDLIETSRASNRASLGDMKAMLAPLLTRLGEMVATPAAAPKVPGPGVPSTPPQGGSNRAWQSVVAMAEQADLDDLHTAMSIYLDRMHTALYEAEKRSLLE